MVKSTRIIEDGENPVFNKYCCFFPKELGSSAQSISTLVQGYDPRASQDSGHFEFKFRSVAFFSGSASLLQMFAGFHWTVSGFLTP